MASNDNVELETLSTSNRSNEKIKKFNLKNVIIGVLCVVAVAQIIYMVVTQKGDVDAVIDYNIEVISKFTGVEAPKSKENFKHNFFEVKKHNERFENDNETYEVEVNHLAFYSFIERSKFFIKILPKIAKLFSREKRGAYETKYLRIRNLKRNDVDKLEKEWELTSYLLPPVNQGADCGSCYAFAAIATIEGAMAMRGHITEKLSETEAIECTNGCDCGYSEWIYDYMVKKGGAAAASDYPYLLTEEFKEKKSDFNCEMDKRDSVNNSKIIGYSNCQGQSKVTIEECMKYILAKKGPLMAYIQYDESLDHYHDGIYTGSASNSLVYHAITIVGYGHDSGFNYWLGRNSYGKIWGNKGYFKVLRGENTLNLENGFATFPVFPDDDLISKSHEDASQGNHYDIPSI